MHETRDRWRNRATVKKNNKYRTSRPGGETIEKKDIGRKARSNRAGERTKKKKRERKDTLAITQFNLTTFGAVFRRAQHSTVSNWPHDEVIRCTEVSISPRRIQVDINYAPLPQTAVTCFERRYTRTYTSYLGTGAPNIQGVPSYAVLSSVDCSEII